MMRVTDAMLAEHRRALQMLSHAVRCREDTLRVTLAHDFVIMSTPISIDGGAPIRRH